MPTNPKPGPDAGKISQETVAARGPSPLSAGERQRARCLRFIYKMDFAGIAAILKRSEEDIRHSLANARMPSEAPKRATLNVSLESYEEFQKLQKPGESVWATFNRIMGLA